MNEGRRDEQMRWPSRCANIKSRDVFYIPAHSRLTHDMSISILSIDVARHEEFFTRNLETAIPLLGFRPSFGCLCSLDDGWSVVDGPIVSISFFDICRVEATGRSNWRHKSQSIN